MFPVETDPDSGLGLFYGASRYVVLFFLAAVLAELSDRSLKHVLGHNDLLSCSPE